MQSLEKQINLLLFIYYVISVTGNNYIMKYSFPQGYALVACVFGEKL
jgi:hypothetical protein